jgi:hypothetical protein
MIIISDLYFVGENYVPNVTILPGAVSSITEFQTFIGLKETDYLEQFFGYELAKIIIAAVVAFNTDATPLPTRIADIINGVEFTDLNGRLQKWKGLKRPTDLISPIANFVYYYWMRKEISKTTLSGEVMNETENSKNIGRASKMYTNWETGVIQNRILAEFMQVNLATYPEYQEWIYSFSYFGYVDSRLNLLTNLSAV